MRKIVDKIKKWLNSSNEFPLCIAFILSCATTFSLAVFLSVNTCVFFGGFDYHFSDMLFVVSFIVGAIGGVVLFLTKDVLID